MLWWILIVLVAVLLTKVYTSREIQHLSAKAHRLKADVREAKARLRTAAARQAEAEDELERMEFRVQNIKQINKDLNFRLEKDRTDAAVP